MHIQVSWVSIPNTGYLSLEGALEVSLASSLLGASILQSFEEGNVLSIYLFPLTYSVGTLPCKLPPGVLGPVQHAAQVGFISESSFLAMPTHSIYDLIKLKALVRWYWNKQALVSVSWTTGTDSQFSKASSH